jgi:hypothetical protein
LADGIDPSTAKSDEQLARAALAINTFEAIAREWLIKTSTERMDITQSKVSTWLDKDVIPYIGKKPISTIRCLQLNSRLKHLLLYPFIYWKNKMLLIKNEYFIYLFDGNFGRFVLYIIIWKRMQ